MPLAEETGIHTHDDHWSIRGPLTCMGSFAPPGDKSLAHRAFLLASLAAGPCQLHRVPASDDVLRTRVALMQLGVEVHDDGVACTVRGVGLRGLRPAGAAIDCGNSGTTMRLLLGVLAAQTFESQLTGDASLLRRPMRRVVAPLRAMGADVTCHGADDRPPLRIGAPFGETLRGVEHRLQVDSAQVRSAILLAGLHARGRTRVRPVGAARDHTERMLRALGVDLECSAGATELHPKPETWEGFTFHVPGDLSALAFFIGALSLGDVLEARGVSLNPGRMRYLEIVRDAGLEVQAVEEGRDLGEPWGTLRLRGALRRSIQLAGQDTVRCIDEIPALLAAAATAGVEARVEDAAELRHKESDRIAAMVELLRRFGARVHATSDRVHVEAGASLRAARVASHGDHRVAMAAAVLATGVRGESIVEDIGCVATSYVDFAQDLQRLSRRPA